VTLLCNDNSIYLYVVLLSSKSQKSLPYSAAVAVALKKVMFMSHPPIYYSRSKGITQL